MNRTLRTLVAIVAFAAPAPFLDAEKLEEVVNAPTRRTFKVASTSDRIVVDGKLDEELWKRTQPIEISFETFPGNNTPARARTEAWIAYDEAKLYLAFKAHDPKPSEIRARLSDRDRAYQDDFVGVMLDTFNDERRGFEFFVNPLGVQMDLTVDDVGTGEDDSWDAIWDSAGQIVEDGYIVEMAIPFSSLRFKDGAEAQTWGLDIVRVYPRDQRYIHRLQQQDRDRSCYICQVSKLEGLEGLSPGKNIELVPTVTANRTDSVGAGSGDSLEPGEVDTQLGLTARWGFTPNLTLNAALNPDFSQVEADAAQLDVNSQFTLFYPEKRPFFLEGADFFNTQFNAVYTRTVSDPDWGGKVTGKQGRSAIGAFVASDSVTNILIPGKEGSGYISLDEPHVASVFRYRYDLGENSTVGVLLTDREGDHYSNRVGGVDAYYRVTEKDTLSAQILTSQTEYPGSIVEAFDQPAGSLDDLSYRVNYRHRTREWFWRATYEDVGDEFRADSGFMPRVDYKTGVVGMERTWWGDDKTFYNRFFIGGDVDRTDDQSGNLIEEEYEVWGGIGLPRQTFVWVGGGTRDRAYRGTLFAGETFYSFWIETAPVGEISASLEGAFGDQIDFANVQPGKRTYLAPSLTYRAGRNLQLSLSHTYSTLDVDDGNLFKANLTELRAVYQINIRTFVRAVLQYTDIERNPELYDFPVEAKEQSLFPQFLFSYKLNPQTVFFFGYSDNRFGDETSDLTQTDRTYFTKIGYAWLF